MDAFNLKLLVDFPASSAYSGFFDSHFLPFVCGILLIAFIYCPGKDTERDVHSISILWALGDLYVGASSFGSFSFPQIFSRLQSEGAA